MRRVLVDVPPSASRKDASEIPIGSWLKKIPAGMRPGVCVRIFLLSEVIVYAGAEQSEAVAIRHAGDRESAVVEIDIEIFELGAPARRKQEFGAEPRSPTDVGVALRQAEGLPGQFAEGETRRAI